MNIGDLIVQIGAIGNSKEVKAFGEAVKKAGKAIDDFDKKQGKTEAGAKGLSNIFGKMPMKLLGIAGAVATAYFALDRLTESLAKQNQQWLLFANSSGVAMSTLQKWNTIGKITGIDNAEQQLESLNQKIFQARLTGEGGADFAFAGITPTTSEDVMEQLRSRVASMNNTQATYILNRLGIDPKMLTLLRMTRKEWEKYVEIQKKFTLTEKQRREIEKLNRSLQVAKLKWQYLKDRAILAIMPVFVRFTEIITETAVGITKLVKLTVDWVKELPSVVKWIGAISLALLALNFHPIIAGFSALLIIADDVLGYFEGKDSVLGMIVNGLKDLDIKGYIDFPVPKWMEYLIEIIHFFRDNPLPTNAFNLSDRAFNLGDKLGDWIIGKFNPGYNAGKNITNNISMPVTVYSNNPIQDVSNKLIYTNILGINYGQ